MNLVLESFIFSIGHGNDKSTLVWLVGNCNLGVSWQVKTIDLIEHFDEIISCKSIVDGNDANSSLLKELDVSARNIAWCILCIGKFLIAIVNVCSSLKKLTTKWFGKNTNDGSLRMIDEFLKTKLLCLSNHIVLSGSLGPSLLKVVSTCQQWVLNCVHTIKHANSCNKGCRSKSRLHYLKITINIIKRRLLTNLLYSFNL